MPPVPQPDAPRTPHLSPARRRRCIEHVRQRFQVSERRACHTLGQHRSTQRKVPRGRDGEEALSVDIIALARKYSRYGTHKITALLWNSGLGGKRQEGRADLDPPLPWWTPPRRS